MHRSKNLPAQRQPRLGGYPEAYDVSNNFPITKLFANMARFDRP